MSGQDGRRMTICTTCCATPNSPALPYSRYWVKRYQLIRFASPSNDVSRLSRFKSIQVLVLKFRNLCVQAVLNSRNLNPLMCYLSKNCFIQIPSISQHLSKILYRPGKSAISTTLLSFTSPLTAINRLFNSGNNTISTARRTYSRRGSSSTSSPESLG